MRAGVKKIGEGDNEGAEPEYKFEWQRTWGHAPKESYLEKGDDYNEQPFGIQVGNNGVYFHVTCFLLRSVGDPDPRPDQ
jgi:hypothetical protein